MITDNTKRVIAKIPCLKSRVSPDDKDKWPQRLKEEYESLIKYVESNKVSGHDWFQLESNGDGTQWWGKCWHIYEMERYEFKLNFELPITYPLSPPELILPDLDGLTAKMYRGGRICTDDHFVPLWNRNVPKFGIAHALALGLAPWLAVEIPLLVGTGKIKPTKS
ncbi:hypothetical protein GJ496_004692 [Pomphorhynchus laevis]|nr:hypothetical protein GJ496_004692 [Pomphorhynchus laevis]